MGTGDPSDPTTDFFTTHRAQCAYRATKLVGVPDAAALMAEMNASVTLCDAAIAGGRRRNAISAVLASLAQIKTLYEATTQTTKDNLRAAIAADGGAGM